MVNDITWHISKSNKREPLTNSFIKTDNRVKIYDINCNDDETFKKRNSVLETLTNGYFCFLDDDTILHRNMYLKYKQCIEHNFIGMIIGQQLSSDGSIRLIASKPVYQYIDTGNVISHTNCLKVCRWPEKHIEGVNQKDFLFWESVYNFYGKRCGIWNNPLSIYNKLRE
jgi:hypothetical protein